MKATLKHRDGMAFDWAIRGHHGTLDTALLGGKDRGPSPKELLLPILLGCTGMDVVALLKKFQVPFTGFSLSASAEPREPHPRVFGEIAIEYALTGDGIPLDKVREAVDLSMTKYCAVSAMVSKAVSIRYHVLVNGEKVHEGTAKFPPL